MSNPFPLTDRTQPSSLTAEDPRLAGYAAELDSLTVGANLRSRQLVEPLALPEPMMVQVAGYRAVNFSGNDYLGLSSHPVLKQAAAEAAIQAGTGSGSSRLISGTGPLAEALEQAIRQFKHTEAALVFASGYQANVAILQALTGPKDFIFADRLNHASLVDGCRLSGARWQRYHHLDFAHLERLLQKAPPQGRKWIVTDSVFSMDGDYPDLAALLDLADAYGALVMVDEAHATGLYGSSRRSGLCEKFGVGHRVALQMGTFSKALGGSGAYVAGSSVLIETLVNKARGFIYTTAPSPPTLAAALAAVELLRQDDEHTRKLWKNIACLEEALIQANLSSQVDLPLKSPIVPILIGGEAETTALSQALLIEGYFVHAIRPPTVPVGTSRLRLSLSAAHSQSQIEGLVDALQKQIAN